MRKVYETLFKIDTSGRVRLWSMEQVDDKHRTISGLQDGKLVASGWTKCIGTNVGRANERDPVAQASFEISAQYEHQLTREYHRDLEGACGGAHFFKPMLAEKFTEFAPGYAQPKLDGIRCIIKADGMWSRQGKPIFGAPHIFKALETHFEFNPRLILDGELYNDALKDDFNTIVSVVKKQKPTPEQLKQSERLVQYHTYDLPSHADLPFSKRADLLSVLVHASPRDIIHLVETRPVATSADYDTCHGRWLEAGYEGSIWRADAPYEQKRSKHLRKRKEFIDEEFVCVRIEEGLGNWAGAAKRVICRMPDGREFGAGIKGSYERGQELLKEKHNIVTVKYFQLTPDGIPRFGVATKFHGDKREL